MKILMMTNSYFPMVGGIEQSIRLFSREFRKLGHEVLIMAPNPSDRHDRGENVVRIPAIEHNREPHFSINLPVPGMLSRIMRTFGPDIVHSHYPFFIGDYALRLSRQFQVPMVFTYHIMFEHYTHYLPISSEAAKRFTTTLAAGYANWAQQVVAPSESVRDVLLERGVTSPIEVVPTGVDIKAFAGGRGSVFRSRHQIPRKAFVVGHVGRLAPEKNLDFLIPCLVDFLKLQPVAHALIVGKGISVSMIRRSFKQAGLGKRLHMTGFLHDENLCAAYRAMDVFAFASLSETQGMVLTEAMAAGIPVVALRGPGVSEIVRNYTNGRLIDIADHKKFVKALKWVYASSPERARMLKAQAGKTAQTYSIGSCARRMLDIYERLQSKNYARTRHPYSAWHAFTERLKAEGDILKNVVEAGEAVISHA